MALDDESPTLENEPDFDFRRPRGAHRPWLYATAASALIGAAFAAVSTSDFISHLDRQVHSIHCSLIPGAGAALGESGCRTVMMSPYSSLFRQSLWGGLPISLLALAVFAYLVYRALDFATRRTLTKRDTAFLIAATLLPVLMSGIYGYISSAKVGAICKLCAGIYATSGSALLFALLAHRNAPAARGHDSPLGTYLRWFGEGVAYVALLSALYVGFAPTTSTADTGCGRLVRQEDKHGVVLPYSKSAGGTAAIAVLDPLCPACKAFEQRLDASGLRGRLDMRAVLFPLDSKCNWMLKTALHPGACAVSEAALCAPDSAEEVVRWAFEHQEELTKLGRDDEDALRARIEARFPSVRGCLGSSKVKNKLNKSLRWAVANALPVLTPQLFIGDRRVCDEDTDLGLEFTIASMIGGTR